jgi:copper chaperone NosL
VEMFQLLLRPEQVRKVVVVYVQDMGRADWDHSVGHWVVATGAWYVRGSRRMGSMGPTLASFAQEADALRFAAEHGGTVLRFGEVTVKMIDLGGGADFEVRM